MAREPLASPNICRRQELPNDALLRLLSLAVIFPTCSHSTL